VDVFDEDEGWEEARDEDGIRTMYRYEEGLPTISVRIEGAVDASVLQVSPQNSQSFPPNFPIHGMEYYL